MEGFAFGFYLGMSLILAIGPQNLFVIEQGLKRHHVFLVCLICSVSDFMFIAIGTAAFYYFSETNQFVDLILNLLLLAFIFNFIWNKLNSSSSLYSFNESYNEAHTGKVVLRTLAFTYLNPHVYSDTIFIIGGFSRELMLDEKIFFVIGAASASLIYFFSLGYASSYFATFINNQKGWQLINRIVIFVMLLLSIFVIHKIVATLVSI
jgi:L-lysine exporter family protein LysE/ArgO